MLCLCSACWMLGLHRPCSPCSRALLHLWPENAGRRHCQTGACLHYASSPWTPACSCTDCTEKAVSCRRAQSQHHRPARNRCGAAAAAIQHHARSQCPGSPHSGVPLSLPRLECCESVTESRRQLWTLFAVTQPSQPHACSFLLTTMAAGQLHFVRDQHLTATVLPAQAVLHAIAAAELFVGYHIPTPPLPTTSSDAATSFATQNPTAAIQALVDTLSTYGVASLDSVRTA